MRFLAVVFLALGTPGHAYENLSGNETLSYAMRGKGKGKSNDRQDGSLISTVAGGGWRSLFSMMGLGSVFASEGLFPADGSSPLDLMAGSSGGVWFLVQLFYAQEFFDAITTLTGDALEDFASNWYDGLIGIYPEEVPPTAECASIKAAARNLNGEGLSPLAQARIGDIQQLIFIGCDLFVTEFESNFEVFISTMLDAGARTYGKEGLTTTLVTDDNKIYPLNDVDVNIHTTLTPSSRSFVDGTTTYAGPKRSYEERVNRVNLPFQWSSGGGWFPGDLFEKIKLYITDSSSRFDFSNYDNYFPSSGGGSLVSKLTEATVVEELGFWAPETPTVGQISAASSAFVMNRFTPSPPVFSGFYTPLRDAPPESGADAYFQQVWDSPIFQAFAVCTDYVAECPKSALFLTDAWQTDDNALSMSIGAQQAKVLGDNHYDMGRGGKSGDDIPPLKIIHWLSLDPSSNFDLTYDQVFQHFATIKNDGVEPGGYMPFELNGGPRFPRPSKQVFEEYLDAENFFPRLIQIDDTEFRSSLAPTVPTYTSYVEFELTTVDNPLYRVRGGQKVNLLFFHSAAIIPTTVLGRQFTIFLKGDHVRYMRTVADSEGIKNVVNGFLSD